MDAQGLEDGASVPQQREEQSGFIKSTCACLPTRLPVSQDLVQVLLFHLNEIAPYLSCAWDSIL